MHLTIEHSTTYEFEDTPDYGLQQVRLKPKDSPSQRVENWELSVTGGEFQAEFNDHYRNVVTLLSIDAHAESITVRCQGLVETTDTSGVLGKHRGFVPLWYFKQPTDLTRAGSELRGLTRGLRETAAEPIACLHELSRRVADTVVYQTGTTDIQTTAEDAVQRGHGVCQDHAHIFIGAARHLRFPARYVSGYLMAAVEQPQYAGHAWAEIYVESLGWVGFDVSNQVSPDARYVRVATGLDYHDAAPISGLRFGKGGEAMSVEICVQQQ